MLRTLPDNSVDSLVTDPPAGISFMGKSWDDDKGGRDEWIAWLASVMRECHRVMKPGAHGLVWALPRTSHWTAMALEHAGFEVRDRVSHLFGSGFPKSLNVSIAIDKAAGAERDVVGPKWGKRDSDKMLGVVNDDGWKPEGTHITAPATPAAKQWEGWGTALKPACEDWWLIRKPCSEKTVAANVLKWGTGALNIDGARIDSKPRTPGYKNPGSKMDGTSEWNERYGGGIRREVNTTQGRFPSHLVLSCDCEGEEHGQMCAVAMLDTQSGERGVSKGGSRGGKRTQAFGMAAQDIPLGFGDSGGASRFFYCAKVSASERNAGLEGMPKKVVIAHDSPSRMSGSSARKAKEEGGDSIGIAPRANTHPTVKPQKLMRYLCRLITPPGGTVLDCFMGSGSTGLAAKSEGFGFIGIEREPEYFEIASKRIENCDLQAL